MQKYLIILFFLFLPLDTIAEDNNYFVMLKNKKVNVRYGPSLDYPIKYIYKKIGLPLKVIDKKENFRRVIDYKKNSGWIHVSQLKPSRSLVTTTEKILFKKPTKYSKPLAKIDQGRLLRVINCEKKWCNIRTGNYKGWIENNIGLWGLKD